MDCSNNHVINKDKLINIISISIIKYRNYWHNIPIIAAFERLIICVKCHNNVIKNKASLYILHNFLNKMYVYKCIFRIIFQFLYFLRKIAKTKTN